MTTTTTTAPPNPKCWCGAEMKPAGRGEYPYDCQAVALYPNSMVWIGCDAGHNCWMHEHSAVSLPVAFGG